MLFLLGIWFVPSTPQYHLRKNNMEPAQKAFNYYNKHRLQTDPKFCMVQFESLRDVATVNKTESKLTWKDIGEYIFWAFIEKKEINFCIAFFPPNFSRFPKRNIPSDNFFYAERIDRTNRFFNLWIQYHREIGHGFITGCGFNFYGCGSAMCYILHIPVNRQ